MRRLSEHMVDAVGDGGGDGGGVPPAYVSSGWAEDVSIASKDFSVDAMVKWLPKVVLGSISKALPANDSDRSKLRALWDGGWGKVIGWMSSWASEAGGRLSA